MFFILQPLFFWIAGYAFAPISDIVSEWPEWTVWYFCGLITGLFSATYAYARRRMFEVESDKYLFYALGIWGAFVLVTMDDGFFDFRSGFVRVITMDAIVLYASIRLEKWLKSRKQAKDTPPS